MHDELFQPLTMGAIEAKNRIFMAPLTRGRADAGSVPNEIMQLYYTQRASAGLINAVRPVVMIRAQAARFVKFAIFMVRPSAGINRIKFKGCVSTRIRVPLGSVTMGAFKPPSKPVRRDLIRRKL